MARPINRSTDQQTSYSFHAAAAAAAVDKQKKKKKKMHTCVTVAPN